MVPFGEKRYSRLKEKEQKIGPMKIAVSSDNVRRKQEERQEEGRRSRAGAEERGEGVGEEGYGGGTGR